MSGVAFRGDVAQQRGYCRPASLRQERGAHSGLRLAAVDPDATFAAPGVASYEKEEAAGRVAAGVCKDADILGKVVAKRFGDCAVGPNDAQVLVRNG